MKHIWSSLMVVILLGIAAASQTAGASASGSANASVSPGQAAAGANAGQSTQTGAVSANSGAAANANASAFLSQGSTLHTELSKPVDAKKCKPGDEVTAKVTEDVKYNGKVVVRKGSKVVGHVTEVQAHSKEHADSRVGISFDKLMMSGGQEMAFSGVIQAIAPPVQAGAAAQAATMDSATADGGGRGLGGGRPAGGSGGLGGVAGGAVSTVGSTAGAATHTAGSVGGDVGATAGAATRGLSTQGSLTAASTGVVGLQGLALASSTAANAQGSLITSPSQNVRLDSGTQMLLRVAAPAR